MLFPAKRDTWCACLTMALVLCLVGGGAWLVYSGVSMTLLSGLIAIQLLSEPFTLMLGLLMPLFGAMLLWLLASTQYEITESDLVLESGPSRRRISLDRITGAVPTQNPFTGSIGRGPAWSMDMLRISYSKPNGRPARAILISPVDRAAFLRRLAEAAPELEGDVEAGLHRTAD